MIVISPFTDLAHRSRKADVTRAISKREGKMGEKEMENEKRGGAKDRRKRRKRQPKLRDKARTERRITRTLTRQTHTERENEMRDSERDREEGEACTVVAPFRLLIRVDKLQKLVAGDEDRDQH